MPNPITRFEDRVRRNVARDTDENVRLMHRLVQLLQVLVAATLAMSFVAVAAAGDGALWVFAFPLALSLAAYPVAQPVEAEWRRRRDSRRG